MKDFLDKLSDYSPLVLRVGVAFVFLWFGWSGIANPQMWMGLVPAWTTIFGSAYTLVIIHGWVELILGLLLFAGIIPRIAAGILFLSLLQTLTLVSWGPVMARDIGLAAATLALALRE